MNLPIARNITTELADPRGEEAMRLLGEYARDMAVRYPEGIWGGVDGHKDLLWLCRDAGGRAVGCVALRALGPGRVEVKHLYVVPDARRCGVAGALMDALEAEARRRHAEIVLQTGTRQPAAIAFYRRRRYETGQPYDGSDPGGFCSVYFRRGVSD